jgi:carbonic anhydrase
MSNKHFGLIDNWLRDIKDVYRLHQDQLDAIKDETQRGRRFVELNVMEQVFDLINTSIIQNAWKSGQPLHVHGWVYDIQDGIIKDLDVTHKGADELHTIYRLLPEEIKN